jgi:hypothetical protein
VALGVLLLLSFAAADPYVNEAPLGAKTGCAVHKLAFEYAQHLQPQRFKAGSADTARLYDSLFTGDMQMEKMGNCSTNRPSGRDPPKAASYPLPPSTSPTFYVRQ